MRNPSLMRALLAVTIACLAASSLQAQEPAAGGMPREEPGVVVTEEARAALGRMQRWLAGQETYAVTAHASRDEVLGHGYKLQNNETARMVVRLPDRMRVDVDGDIKHRSYIYDGETLTMFAPDENVYARTSAPATLREVINGLLNAGVEMPLIDVLRQGVDGSLLEGVRYGLKVGDATIDGVRTEHLAFRQAEIDWQLWVTPAGQPRKLLITTRYEVGDPQYQAVLTWESRPRIDAKTFTFDAPKGAREIPFARPAAASAGTQ